MYFSDSLNTSDTTNQSSLFPYKYFEDISSIIPQDPDPFPPASMPNPSNILQFPVQNKSFQDLYEENLILKKKIQDLQSSLKTNPANDRKSDSFLTEFEGRGWIRSNTQYFCDGNNDSCIRSLSEEFEAALEAGSVKRHRDMGREKGPKKFIKLAMMKSIGTLKF